MTEIDRRAAIAGAAMIGGLAAAGTVQARTNPRHSPSAMLDMLATRWAVEEVVFDYARGNDHADEAMIRGCFWPEATLRHGGYDGTAAGFVDFAMKILPRLKYSKHHISNFSVRVKGGRAFSECYYYAHHTRDRKDGQGEEDVFFEGRYIDIFERRAGAWKIIRRRGMTDWNSAATPAATLYSAMPAGTHALRSEDDEYYRMLAIFEAM
jgi:hypothetical protein